MKKASIQFTSMETVRKEQPEHISFANMVIKAYLICIPIIGILMPRAFELFGIAAIIQLVIIGLIGWMIVRMFLSWFPVWVEVSNSGIALGYRTLFSHREKIITFHDIRKIEYEHDLLTFPIGHNLIVHLEDSSFLLERLTYDTVELVNRLYLIENLIGREEIKRFEDEMFSYL